MQKEVANISMERFSRRARQFLSVMVLGICILMQGATAFAAGEGEGREGAGYVFRTEEPPAVKPAKVIKLRPVSHVKERVESRAVKAVKPKPTEEPSKQVGSATSEREATKASDGADKKHPLETLNVAEVKASPTKHFTENQLLALVPELEKEEVNVGRLSKQIQLANDGNAVKLSTEFQPISEDRYRAELKAEDQKAEAFSVNVNNTGNEYSGNVRMGVTYVNRNLTGVSDSLGVAYVTSPGHWEDVKQAAVAYRVNLPKAGDSMYATYSWSDVDLGMIGNFNGLGIMATGRGATAGIHYQHNFKYTKAHRQVLDIGFDQKHYKNSTVYGYIGRDLRNSTDYDVSLISVNYTEIQRKPGSYLSWSVGYSGNLKKDEGFQSNRANSSGHFHLLQGNINYQRLLPKNWLFGVRLGWQYTRQNVVTTEQFGAGGMLSVRGFKERAAYADRGWMGTLELYTPEILKNSRLVFFLDYAHLSNNSPNPGEISSDAIASYGMGYRYNDKKSGVFLSLDYAHAFRNIHGAKDNLRPWHIMAGIRF